MTRQKALKEQYFFSCTCSRCVKLVPSISFHTFLAIVSYVVELAPSIYSALLSKATFMFKGQFDDIRENAILEGYSCKNGDCSGFLLRNCGTFFLN